MDYGDTLPNQEGYYWKRIPTGFESVKKVFIDNETGAPHYGRTFRIPITPKKGTVWAGPITPPPQHGDDGVRKFEVLRGGEVLSSGSGRSMGVFMASMTLEYFDSTEPIVIKEVTP